MLVIWFLIVKDLDCKKKYIYIIYIFSNFTNLPTIMKPSLVPRVPRDQGFCSQTTIVNFGLYQGLPDIFHDTFDSPLECSQPQPASLEAADTVFSTCSLKLRSEHQGLSGLSSPQSHHHLALHIGIQVGSLNLARTLDTQIYH